ncbi:mitogen-activated protein kinase 7-like [Dreissena polymorpha]|uniref:Mitogen-activated protein kinase n=1 Tax=Dreissena polymorpha TaxID=45954 RepID=A0A9D4NAX8_DREPO|nr:mitogen-activated protein kinase 7-like [Dreissena polymorpha]XP_052239836.1 mitogen-activated protein kinase 7-like [Dreissena polymorpha]XP_052239844.1 mitogen-activated protein kinase 7-like [Dreissena polymorpha]KAH3889977.1 hypothetical protein DPMN_014044 [Dreissena polymorpha]
MGDNKKKDELLQKKLEFLKQRALNVKFDIDTVEFQPIENIGIGAYGVVCSAICRKTNDRVAIKKIPNVFDLRDAAKRAYREIKILKHFKHDNIIHIRKILKPKECMNDFRDVYVVFDLMESDLHKIIYSKQELTEEHVRYFLYQILRGLKYIHSAQVIHRDLKPSNLLVNEDCQLRIGDFGMARGFSASSVEPSFFMTQYVATRFYRAPEIMMSLIEYGAAVDMWSVGCIFAEMLGRKYLFNGKNSIEQIKLIVGLLGNPDAEIISMIQSQLLKSFFQEMGPRKPVSWASVYPKASKKAVNLLGRMLVLNPKKRITVEQALVHPFLNKYHDPDDEPICVPTFNFDFEKENLTLPHLREVIHKEIMEYYEPRTPTFSFTAELRPVPKLDEGKEGPAHGLPSLFKDYQNSQDMKGTPDSSEGQSKSDEAVFKRPLSAKNRGPQVSVLTDNLLKSESDIEMLSARSTDERQPMSATVEEQKSKEGEVGNENLKENAEPVRDEKHKTISEGTKNLIKAALLNASFKKRTDSMSEDERPKPMTAAQRQRQREDKRKKKKEKTLERKRKEKKAATSEEQLTSADMEALNRWMMMQKVNIPIAPRPSNTIATPDQTKTGLKSSDNALPGFSNSERNVQQGTLDLLQQRILANAQDSRQEMPMAEALSKVPSTGQLPDLPLQGVGGVSVSKKASDFSVDFSSVPLGELDFLTMVSSPEIVKMLSQNAAESQQQFPNISRTQSQFSNESTSQFTDNSFVDTTVPFPSADSDTTNFLRSLCASSMLSNENTLNDQHHGYGVQQTNELNVLPNYQNSLLPNPYQHQCQQSSSPGSQHSVSSADRSPHFLDSTGNQTCVQQNQSNSTPSNMMPYFGNISNKNEAQADASLFMGAGSFQNQFVYSNQNFENVRNQSTFQQEFQDSQTSSSNSNSPPPLLVNTRHPQMSFQNIFQSGAMGGHSQQPDETQLDLVSMLTQQLSKSSVHDFCPPLALTPRGTGGGYGVGVDLDSLMDPQPADQGDGPDPEPSPLSSSILADWMDMTSNLNIDLDALEQELTSPMSLSYNDLNMYPS